MDLSVFYCLCYERDISIDILEYQVSEQIVPDLNEDEGIRIDKIRDDHCRAVAEQGKDKNKIHALIWEV